MQPNTIERLTAERRIKIPFTIFCIRCVAGDGTANAAKRRLTRRVCRSPSSQLVFSARPAKNTKLKICRLSCTIYRLRWKPTIEMENTGAAINRQPLDLAENFNGLIVQIVRDARRPARQSFNSILPWKLQTSTRSDRK